MGHDLLILGGGFLGVNVALEKCDERDITLIDSDLTHEYIPGTIELVRERLEEEELTVDLEDFLDDVELVEERVREIRPEEGVVETEKGIYGYDELVVGLGGGPRTFGMDMSHAHDVWSLEGAKELSEDLSPDDRVVVVGSGYVGLEVAGEVAEIGADTVVVEANTRPAPNLSEKSSEKILEMMENKGISFRGGVRVQEVLEDGVRTENDKIEADQVVWSGGVKASEVVQESFDTDFSGIDVNRGLSTEFEDVFAGGDSADTVALKTAHNAMIQAETVADNLGSEGELKRFVPGRAPILMSFGDTGALIYGDEIIWTGFPLRRMKEWVRKYYFLRLKWKNLV